MKKYLIAVSILSILCSCHKDDEEIPEKQIAQRTVLIYMAAENNLASYADDDLNEMKIGSQSLADNQNLIVYVDRANSLTTPYLARVKNGLLVDTVFMKEGLSADPTILEQTIRYTKEHFPAKNYGLVLWGHASGWLISNNDSISPAMSRAFGGSTGNNSSSGSGNYWMNIIPMAKAIKNAMGNDKLKFIMGDCCSFGCVEVAYELRQVTDYVIGSPAEIPDMGAPFDLIVPDMFLETSTFYQKFIDDYFNYYLDVYKNYPNRYFNSTNGDLAGYSVPLSALNTSKLDQLAYATAKILSTIGEKVSTESATSLQDVTYYAIYGSYRYSYDLKHYLKKNAAAEDYSEWLTAFNEAVPHSVFSQRWMTAFSRLMNEMKSFNSDAEDCGCVSMFFPSDSYSSTSPNWNTGIQQYQWNDIIQWERYGW